MMLSLDWRELLDTPYAVTLGLLQAIGDFSDTKYLDSLHVDIKIFYFKIFKYLKRYL